MQENEFPDGDTRSTHAIGYDAIVEEVRTAVLVVRELSELQRSSRGNVQTVIHKNEGMGNWGVAAVVACFFTYLSMILLTVVFLQWIVPIIHDHDAYIHKHADQILKLQEKPK